MSAAVEGPAALETPRFHTSPDGVSVPKHCPFCRGEAAVNTIQWSADHLEEQGLPEGVRYGVNCMRCGACLRGGNGAATAAEAIAQWNKRTEPTAIVALVEQNKRLRTAHAAALAYIAASPCDPDTTPEQWHAWEAFVVARDAALGAEVRA